MIVDSGLDALFTGLASTYVSSYTDAFDGSTSLGAYALFKHVVVGSGTAVPLATDTTLGDQKAISTSPTYGGVFTDIGTFGDFKLNIVNSLDADSLSLVGLTLSEIGLICNDNTTLFARDLIRDSGGTPITVSLLVGDTLTVEWEVSFEGDEITTGQVTVAGLLYDWTVTREKMTYSLYKDRGNWNFWVCDIGTTSKSAYVSGSFTDSIDVSFGVLESNDQTVGIQAIQVAMIWEFATSYADERRFATIEFELNSDPTKGLIRLPDQELVIRNVFKTTYSRA